MNKIYQIGKKLFPIHRSLTGKGNLKTLKILKKFLPELQIKYFKSGTKVYDWVVPSEWNVSEAYIKDKYNKKIIDFKNNNLHLVSYSQKIKKKILKKKLIKYLYTNPRLKEAIPYVTSYYKRTWGFCMTQNQLNFFKKNYKENDFFFIKINSTFNKKGKMHYGEIYIPGKCRKEILLSTNICHPSMANNELSGPLVLTRLAKYFKKKKNNRSIRILFLPETIGSIAYIKKNYERLKKNVIGGYIITCIGDERNYSFLYSKYKNSLSDLAAKKAYKKLGIKYKKYSFLERGSDERQFNSPYIDLNLSSIMRTKYTKYKEYHTSLDNFSVLTKKGLSGGYRVALSSIENLMSLKVNNNKRKKQNLNSNPLSKLVCEPKLSKRGLYNSLSNTSYGNKNKLAKQRKNILNFIQYSDGSNSLKKISEFIKLPIGSTRKIFILCKKYNLVH